VREFLEPSHNLLLIATEQLDWSLRCASSALVNLTALLNNNLIANRVASNGGAFFI
jgi:hypothetical protein